MSNTYNSPNRGYVDRAVLSDRAKQEDLLPNLLWSSSYPLTDVWDTTNAGGLFTLTSTGKILAKNGSGTFNSFLKYKKSLYSIDETEKLTMEFVVNGYASNSYGQSIGWISINTNFYMQTFVLLDLSTSGVGALKIYTKDNANSFVVLAQDINAWSIAPAVGDVIQLSIERLGTDLIAKALNLTSGLRKVVSVTNSLDGSSAFQIQNCSSAAICRNGSDSNGATITKFNVESCALRSPSIGFYGDSKTVGIYSGVLACRFANVAANALGKSFSVFAGQGDKTIESVLSIPHSLKFSVPKTAILNIGRNDLAYSVSSATWQKNYAAVVSSFREKDVKVIHLLPIPETAGLDQSDLRSWIISNYGVENCIDPSVGFNTSTMLYSDGVHPNATGHAFIASLISAFSYNF